MQRTEPARLISRLLAVWVLVQGVCDFSRWGAVPLSLYTYTASSGWWAQPHGLWLRIGMTAVAAGPMVLTICLAGFLWGRQGAVGRLIAGKNGDGPRFWLAVGLLVVGLPIFMQGVTEMSWALLEMLRDRGWPNAPAWQPGVGAAGVLAGMGLMLIFGCRAAASLILGAQGWLGRRLHVGI